MNTTYPDISSFQLDIDSQERLSHVWLLTPTDLLLTVTDSAMISFSDILFSCGTMQSQSR